MKKDYTGHKAMGDFGWKAGLESAAFIVEANPDKSADELARIICDMADPDNPEAEATRAES